MIRKLVSIKIGNNKIGSVAIGDTSITKIYKGTELLYQKKSNIVKIINTTNSALLWFGLGQQVSVPTTPNELTTIYPNKNNYLGGMFYSLSNIKYVDFSSYDFTNQTNLGTLFYNCTGLESINFGSFDFSNITEVSYMFYGCTALNHIKCSQAIKDWIIENQDTMQLPTAMRNGGTGTWEIID